MHEISINTEKNFKLVLKMIFVHHQTLSDI